MQALALALGLLPGGPPVLAAPALAAFRFSGPAWGHCSLQHKHPGAAGLVSKLHVPRLGRIVPDGAAVLVALVPLWPAEPRLMINNSR